MTDQDSFQEIHQDPDLLAVKETGAYRLALRLVNDQMECVASIELKTCRPDDLSPDIDEKEIGATEKQDFSDKRPAERTEKESVYPQLSACVNYLEKSEFIGFLHQHQVTRNIDEEAIIAFCSALDLRQVPPPTVVARGSAPEPGADGWFELLVKVSGEEQEFIPDSKGRIDLKRLNAYTEIEPEQKLGVIHPPEPGIPGCTVLGQDIEAPAGRLKTVNAGEGVLLKYGGRLAFSTKPGRALYENDTLSVVDQLVIPGNVDLSIGHVDFHGFVEVKGDVLDDFDIRSTKGIKVTGHVGACHLESRGSIEIGAMAGREIGRVLCQGDFRARFLNQVTVVCYGDVYVNNEIRNSHVRTTGHVVVDRGAIIGGETVALKGVSAAVIGTGSGQRTSVAAGVYFPDADRFSYLKTQLLNVNRQIESINLALGPLRQYQHGDSGFAEAHARRLKVLNDKLDLLYEQKNAFYAEIAASQPQLVKAKNPKINVQKVLKDGAVIVLGNVREDIRIDRQGPLSIIENTRTGGLHYLSLSPLPVPAVELERHLYESSGQAGKGQDPVGK